MPTSFLSLPAQNSNGCNASFTNIRTYEPAGTEFLASHSILSTTIRAPKGTKLDAIHVRKESGVVG